MKAIHGLDGQKRCKQRLVWNDGQEWKSPSEQSTAESQRAAPTQPVAEPEAAKGWIVAGELDCWCGECAGIVRRVLHQRS